MPFSLFRGRVFFLPVHEKEAGSLFSEVKNGENNQREYLVYVDSPYWMNMVQF